MELSASAKQEIWHLMAGLEGREARDMALQLSRDFEVCERTIYMISASGRKIKKRKSGRKLPVSDDVLMEMLAFTCHTNFPARKVIQNFVDKGNLAQGLISPAWFTRWLKKRGMSRREMKIDRRPRLRRKPTMGRDQ